MNIVTHRKLIIEFDVWEPMTREVDTEVDDLLGRLKTKRVLAHAGNVRAQLG